MIHSRSTPYGFLDACIIYGIDYALSLWWRGFCYTCRGTGKYFVVNAKKFITCPHCDGAKYRENRR